MKVGSAPYLNKRGFGKSNYSVSEDAGCSVCNSMGRGGWRADGKCGIKGLSDDKFIVATNIASDDNTLLSSLSLDQLDCAALTISAPNMRDRWYLSAKVHSQGGDFLIDGGANSTMITKDFYETLSPRPHLVPSGVEVSVANGGIMQVHGLTTVPFSIDGRLYMMRCLVMVGLSQWGAGILGVDFQHIYKCALEGWSGKFHMNEYQHVAWAKPESALLSARLTENLYIPPRRTIPCSVTMPRTKCGGLKLRYEPTEKLAWMGVSAGPGLVSETEPRIALWNPSSMGIRLNAGTVVGALYLDIVSVRPLTEAYDENAGKQPEVLSEDGDRDDEILYPDVMPKVVEEDPLELLVAESHLIDMDEKEAVRQLLQRNKVCFALPGDSLGRTGMCTHKIDTGDAPPIKQSYRRMPLARQQRTESDLRKLLERKVIEPSKGPWGFPLVIVGKKDGTERLCVDYRKLNLVTRKDSYPLPRMDECIEALGGNKYFIALDLESGYWQIAMDEESKAKTSFISSLGLFQFKVMSFGLCNAPATFQRLMDQMLDGLKFKKCLVYIDDIVIFGKTFEETLENFECVLERIEAYGVKLKPKKCKLFRTEVEYLGRIVSQEGIKADPAKVKAVQEWPRPQTVKDIRSFLGFASYYREFQPNFAGEVAPLQAVVREGNNAGRCHQKINWSVACERAFQSVKRNLMTPPVLGYPDANGGKFILDTDASGFAMSGVLSQIQNGHEVVLSYASNGFNDRQKNYCTTKRELLAVVTYLNKFRHFIQYQGDNFMVRTDHASLKWLLHLNGGSAVLQRWLTNIGEFHMKDHHIVHRAGRLHINADALSRPPSKIRGVCNCPSCTDCGPKMLQAAMVTTRGRTRIVEQLMDILPPKDSEPVTVVDQNLVEEDDDIAEYNDPDEGVVPDDELGTIINGYPQTLMSELQMTDKDLRGLKDMIRRGLPKPESTKILGFSVEFESYMAYYTDISIVKDTLMLRWVHKSGRVYNRMLVPEQVRDELFDHFHGNLLVGHYGVNQVSRRLKQRFYWPGMENDIYRWVRACDDCSRRKDKSGQGRSPLTKELHGRRWSKISMDVLGPFPISARGNKFVLVVIDHFTKWTEAYTLPDHTAQTCAYALATNWFAMHGSPFKIQTDGAPEFMSRMLRELADVYQIEKIHSNPYRPQSQGMVERMNRVILAQLSCLVRDDISRWDDMIPLVMSAYRACVHQSTGVSPYYMVYGEEMRMPADIKFGIGDNGLDFPCRVAYMEGIRRNLRRAWEYARAQLDFTAVRQKEYYDRRARPRRFEDGDVVFRFCPPKAQRKTGPKWDGPYIVLRLIGGNTYELKTATGIIRYNGDLLKHCFGRNGMVNVVNLYRTPEYLAQIKLGIVIIKMNSYGQCVPGKDCPQKLLDLVEEYGIVPAPRPRARYNPVTILPEDLGGRVLAKSGHRVKKNLKVRKKRRLKS